MWAAANDDDARRRRRYRNRRHPDGQRRRPSIAAEGADDDDDSGGGGGGKDTTRQCDYDGDSDSTTMKPPHRDTSSSSSSRRGNPGHGWSGQLGGKRMRHHHNSNTATTDNRQQDAECQEDTMDGKKRQKTKKRRIFTREETPEATLLRLQSSYATSMSAVGALHRLSHQLCALRRKKNGVGGDELVRENTDNVASPARMDLDNGQLSSNKEEEEADDNEGEVATYLASLKRVAHAARCAFERTLLLDPVILAPILLSTTSSPMATTIKSKRMTVSVDRGRGRTMNANVMKDVGTAPSSAWMDTWKEHLQQLSKVGSSGSTTPAVTYGSQEVIMQSTTRWNKFSEAQRRIIRQVSYLALVNYADLLLCGCVCHRHCRGDVLDRGAIANLQALRMFPSSLFTTTSVSQEETITTDEDDNEIKSTPPVCEEHHRHSNKCLWIDDESAQQTVRLALAAYCDASELDPTDPTMWFKLACAARTLGRMVDSSSSSSSSSTSLSREAPDIVGPPPRSYRGLERLALERGLSSLPRGVPPNRLISRAWKDMEDWDRKGHTVNYIEDELDQSTDEKSLQRVMDQPTELVLHLPNCSWETLCRILIQASKEGASYGRSSSSCGMCTVPTHVWSTNCRLSEDYEFGSPLVDIRLCLILVLPRHVFGRIYAYLEEPDVKKLACTCRAMTTTGGSAPIARISIETKESNAACYERSTGESVDEEEGINKFLDAETGATEPPHSTNNHESTSLPHRGRTSKRVRSQLMTTEKQAERKSKRSSIHYTLLSGVLSCTAGNPFYTEMLATNQPAASKTPVKGRVLNCSQDNNAPPSHLGLMNTSFSHPSLSEFILRWSRRNSGPRNLLDQLLKHISLNAADVFEGETTSSLSSCVIDCFDTIISSAERSEIGTHWYGAESFTEAGDLDIARTVYAVNLLNAELRFLRCESYDFGSQGQKEDSDFLAFVVTNLLLFASESSEFDSCRKIIELRLRTYWLACSYYLWISRCSDTSIAEAAEGFAHSHLSVAMMLVSELSQGHALRIKTPHLMSHDRRGYHVHEISAEALTKYKEHIQSSAIVSQARLYFQDVQYKLIQLGLSGEQNLDADIKEKLAMLGLELLERFSESADELLNDFQMIHEDDFLHSDSEVYSSQSNKATYDGEVYWGKIWLDIPTAVATVRTRNGIRPSILQVLATSLLFSNEKTHSILLIYIKVALAALSQYSEHYFEAHDILKAKSDQKLEITDGDDCITDDRSRREYLQLRIASFFSDKMTDVIASIADGISLQHELQTFIAGDEIMRNFLFKSFNVSSIRHMDSREAIIYTHHIKSAARLVHCLRNCNGLSTPNQVKLECDYFVALIKAIISLKIDFVYLKCSTTDKRTKAWQSQVASMADVVFVVSGEIAELLSLHPSVICTDGTTRVSHLINALQEHDTTKMSYSVLAQFSDALLWFWDFLHDTQSPANILMVPISSAIIALCGSFGVSVEGSINNADDGSDRGIVSFSDYFDSEDSVNGSFISGNPSEDEEKRSRTQTLRKICQLVQCVSNVFQSVDDKLIGQLIQSFPSSRHGPFLPLVVVRVLSNMSQALFQLFSMDASQVAYPFGARECGAAIDSLLGKAYQYLHGFSFSSGDSSLSTCSYAPESIEAASSLFHCVKRVYRDSRKSSPPNKAFEIVALALPATEETDVSKAIKSFLFDADKDSEVDVLPLSMQNTTALPSGFPEWVFDAESINNFSADEHQNNIERLRRGVSYELAKGSMVNLDSSQKPDNDPENQGLSAERESTQNHELSLYQKFRAVLNDLCYDPTNIERWVVLSECLGFKADSICDRLVRVNNHFDPDEIVLNSQSKRRTSATSSLNELQTSQFARFQESRSKNWKPFLGDSLHVYMQYPWSNLTSLEACAEEVRSCFSQIAVNNDVPAEEGLDSDYLCWKEIESQFINRNYATWANSWGGLFVMALRKMRMKALLVARHLAKNSQEGMHPSEVCEDLGTAVYGDLMASTVYGYPMHRMTLHEKRIIAERSNKYFQEAIELSTCNDYSQKCHIKPFESYFMIGKGHEKIASTLRDEKFVLDSEGALKARLYETVMNDAISNYALAVSDAKNAELSSGPPDKVCFGGSSHGALECVYRLHATRFKVLLNAVKSAPSECEHAELEAYRIASSHWFSESHVPSPAAGIRENAWNSFVDCVDAFNHCRGEVLSFHRAAYRLCQAYNYAPLFHNPSCDLAAGQQAIPTTKRIEVAGLDTGSCAESANVAISTLFDKRRSQLCSVWVTTSAAPSPFEVINDSIRKYDALRMKYIFAFIECMRVCKRIDSIETLLTWTSMSEQDLPGFYEASAILRGGDPGKHSKQSYLSTRGLIAQVKRIASEAIAEIVLSDLAEMKRVGIGTDGRMKLSSHFQLSYRLFLLLNLSCKEVAEFRRSNRRLTVVDAFGKCFLAIQAGYRISSVDFGEMDSETICSILEGASAQAKTMMQVAKNKSRSL